MARIMRCVHDGMDVMLVTGNEDDEFPVSEGVKQGLGHTKGHQYPTLVHHNAKFDDEGAT